MLCKLIQLCFVSYPEMGVSQDRLQGMLNSYLGMGVSQDRLLSNTEILCTGCKNGVGYLIIQHLHPARKIIPIY